MARHLAVRVVCLRIHDLLMQPVAASSRANVIEVRPSSAPDPVDGVTEIALLREVDALAQHVSLRDALAPRGRSQSPEHADERSRERLETLASQPRYLPAWHMPFTIPLSGAIMCPQSAA